MLGVLTGVAGELYALYRQADGERRSRVRRLIGSGNGLRNIPSLCRLTAEAFGLPLFIPAHKEEAAFGAALAALAGAGAVPSLREAQRLIRCLPRRRNLQTGGPKPLTIKGVDPHDFPGRTQLASAT